MCLTHSNRHNRKKYTFTQRVVLDIEVKMPTSCNWEDVEGGPLGLAPWATTTYFQTKKVRPLHSNIFLFNWSFLLSIRSGSAKLQPRSFSLTFDLHRPRLGRSIKCAFCFARLFSPIFSYFLVWRYYFVMKLRFAGHGFSQECYIFEFSPYERINLKTISSWYAAFINKN